MQFTEETLAKRLRSAREACRLTQEQVAEHLGVSRPTLTQIEAGHRKVTGLELLRLASLYGIAMSDLLADALEPVQEHVLLRALAEARSDPAVLAAVGEALSLLREILSLRNLLGRNVVPHDLPAYRLPRATSRWQAVDSGNSVAAQERQRLGLGSSPIADLAALTESHGALVLELDLPEDVSGLAFRTDGSFAFAIHARQPLTRQRFSLAHEYCHALCDWPVSEDATRPNEQAVVCRETAAADLEEVRANAFAAAFLLPEDGVSRFLAGLGKGLPSRPVETVFAESRSTTYVVAEGRMPPRSQDLGPLEISLLADYFGVSRECAFWRLYNLRLMDERSKSDLLPLIREGPQEGSFAPVPPTRRASPGGRLSDDDRHLRSARRMLFLLASEALRREEISAGKFRELARQARQDDKTVAQVLAALGLS